MICQGHKIVVMSHNNSSKLSIDIGEFGERIYRVPDLIGLTEKYFVKLMSLLALKPSASEIRTKSIKTKKTIKWHKKLLYIPDRQIAWAASTSFAAFNLHRSEQFDVILTTSPSESAHIVGWAVKKWKKIPWVADMRDGWMYEPFLEVRKNRGGRQRLEFALEKFLLARADSVTTVTQPLMNDLTGRLEVPEHKAFLVPNGFDEEEYKLSEETIALARRKFDNIDGKMLIVHMGRLSEARKDRDISPLFQALRRFKTLAPDLAQKLSIYFVGSADCPEVGLVEQMELKDVVHFYPMVSKSDAIAMIKVADALLLITSESQKSIATSKVFDYMAVGKPVLALAKGNAAAHIVKQTGIGVTVSPIDISAILDKLKLFMECWNNKVFPFQPIKKQISMYRRENQAKMMAEILKLSAVNR